MKYSLKIEDSGGQATPVCAEGKYLGGVLILEYVFEGADCVLKISEKSIVHTRLGEPQIKMSFAEGEKTFCEITALGKTGKYGVYTQKLKCKVTQNGCIAELAYADNERLENYACKRLTAVRVG